MPALNLPRLLLRLLLGRRLSITSGELTVQGVSHSVTIRRDGYGIPHIEAQSDDDAWYGVGFCQGQDRAFQLELLLRTARGTLSEFTGPRTLALDTLSRRIGFLHNARPQLDLFEPQVRDTFESFAKGLTDGARLGGRRVAHEFALRRSMPTPASAEDVVAVSKLYSFLLASNWRIKLSRYKIMKEDGARALAALEPGYPEWLPVSVPPGASAGAAADRLAQDLAVFDETEAFGAASNAWAVTPSRTAHGRPMLANDLHLPPVLPSNWYLLHVQTPEWAVAGASFVGAPVFPTGHNGHVAWGATAGLADNTDIFIEELGPDGRTVRDGVHFVPCKLRREVIHVKGESDVVEEVATTARGPIIGPPLEDEDGAISLKAMWLDARPTRGLLTSYRARSLDEFRLAFETWPSVSLNMVFASTTGEIGWQLAGQVPRRSQGYGTLPANGWAAGAAWESDPVGFEEMPHAENPSAGLIVSANNRPSTQNGGPYLGIDWIDGYRAARIFESLDAREDWDVAAFQSLQMDIESVPWREMRDIVLGTPAHSADARQALDLLSSWDGKVSADSEAAAVFELFVAEMSRRVAKAQAPLTWEWALGRASSPSPSGTLLAVRRVGHLVRLLREQPDRWLQKDWSAEVEDALARSLKRVRAAYGNEQRQWTWGTARKLTLRHPAGNGRVLSRVFNLGPFPWGGDANTISQAAPDPVDPTGNPIAIASLRMVVEVGNWGNSRFVVPGGQSGNPLSPHYQDMLPLWRRGEGAPIAWSEDDVEKAKISTLRLIPATGKP